jgi:hypothetical protein
MDITNFEFEFYTEVPDQRDILKNEAQARLRDLAWGHMDMIGASVSMEELTQAETPHVYQARIVAYIKPDNVVASEKDDTAPGALKGALDAVERQVRELRAKLSAPWKRPDLTGQY